MSSRNDADPLHCPGRGDRGLTAVPPRGALFIALTLLGLVASSGSSAQTAPPPAPSSSGGAAETRLPPRQFAAVDTFVESIGIEEEAARTIDTFWRPATEALVAGNPEKAAEARAFANARRDAELALYRPLVAFMIDRNAVELLYPEVARQLESLQQEMSRDYARSRSLSPQRTESYVQRARRIRAARVGRVNGDLQAMATLARTPAGTALGELNRTGLFWCVGRHRTGRSADMQAHCARMLQSPILRRLRNAPAGEKLILVSAAAFHQLAAMIAMAHDPGISLHLLLPPETVRAAGLHVPIDMSLDELLARDRSGDQSEG